MNNVHGVGLKHVHVHVYTCAGSHYTWTKVVTTIHNIIIGIDQAPHNGTREPALKPQKYSTLRLVLVAVINFSDFRIWMVLNLAL